jgi:anthranilate synthase / indole-3-glycerol phosphate synthase / phosphoribosylanthranilate isomerase
LIVAILTDEELKTLLDYSRVLGMEPIVEVASKDEMKRAIEAKALVIGVNNRDLNTFEVDMNRTSTLSGMVDEKVILLALSGIRGRDDVERYMKSGAGGVLVGESIMKADNQVEAVMALRGQNVDIDHSVTASSTTKQKPLVKICGLTRIEDAIIAKESGADFLGFIFAKESPRYVLPETVKEIITKLQMRRVLPRNDCFKSTLKSPKSWFEAGNSKLYNISKTLTVGVFTDQTPQEINQIADYCGLDLIQLHKPLLSEFHRLLNRPVIQVIGISALTGLDGILNTIKSVSGSATYILLDTTTTDLVGGTGVKFDWSLVSKVGIPVWMAGGLNADNVKEAIKSGPVLVDVSSGVEAGKGIKDHNKVKLFLRNAKQL